MEWFLLHKIVNLQNMDFSMSLPLNALGSLSKSAPRWCSMSGNSKQLISCFSCTWHWNYQNSFSVCNQSNLILQLSVPFESPFHFIDITRFANLADHLIASLPSPPLCFPSPKALPFLSLLTPKQNQDVLIIF
jgi:hypothetical protein